MKTIIKSVFALLCCGAVLASCNKQTPVSAPEMTADVTAFADIAAHNPGDVAVMLTTKVNWIVQTPSWVTPSVTFGNGNSTVSFKIAENYKDEKTSTPERSGEIVFSGGGTLTGNGAKLVIPIAQNGYTYVDPQASIGGIHNIEEFIEFYKAMTSGLSTKKWTNEDGEVALLASIDLGSITAWQEYASLYSTSNGNNDCSISAECFPFTGTFNGNGYTLSNFNPTVTLAANGTFGLFPALSGATVKNFKLNGTFTVSATGQADAGLVAGTVLNSTITDVTVDGKLISSGTTASARYALGGIAGFTCAKGAENSEISGCVTNVTVEAVGGSNSANGATCAMYGGITGFSTYDKAAGRVKLKGCTNNGNMTVTLGRCSGIVATPNGGTEMENCTNNGHQVNSIADGRLGNICSVIGQDGKLVGCVNNGNIETPKYGDATGTAAGFVGLLNHDTVIIEGGANTGIIKSSRTDGKYIGLLVANFSKFKYVKGVNVSGGIVIAGEAKDINAGNFMDYIGTCSAANLAKVTELTWTSPAK